MIRSETEWFVRYCDFRAHEVLQWSEDAVSDGHRAYAFRQSTMWQQLVANAVTTFRAAGISIDLELQWI